MLCQVDTKRETPCGARLSTVFKVVQWLCNGCVVVTRLRTTTPKKSPFSPVPGTTREQLGTSGNECEKFGFLALGTTMQNLVTLKDGEPRVSTLSIAEYVETTHASVIKLVRKHQIEFERFGSLGFEIQVNSPRADGRGGQRAEHANLNEPQTTLLLTFLRNSERVKECKVRIVKEFFEFGGFGTLPFEMAKSGGRPTEHANLNEQQTTRAHARMRKTGANSNGN